MSGSATEMRVRAKGVRNTLERPTLRRRIWLISWFFTRSNRSAPWAGRQKPNRSRIARQSLPRFGIHGASPNFPCSCHGDHSSPFGLRSCPSGSYFTKRGTVAKAPTLAGAPGLTVLVDGPPERLPGGDTVLVFVAIWMVTVLTFQVLLGKRFKKSFLLVYVVVPVAVRMVGYRSSNGFRVSIAGASPSSPVPEVTPVIFTLTKVLTKVVGG